MYAVIEVAGKQYKVGKGDKIVVDQRDDKAVQARFLMFVDGSDVITDRAKLDGAKIDIKVLEQVRTRSERVMKFKPKQGRSCKKTFGHRQTRRRVSIESLSLK